MYYIISHLTHDCLNSPTYSIGTPGGVSWEQYSHKRGDTAATLANFADAQKEAAAAKLRAEKLAQLLQELGFFPAEIDYN